MKNKYIDIDGEIYKCKLFNPDKKCKKGFAYIKGNFVYPYMGDFDDYDNHTVGIYKKKNGKYKIIKSLSKSYKFKVDLMYDPDDNFINEILENNGIQEQDLDVIMGETVDAFCPIISNEDNALQKLIKRALEKKQIDLKNYACRFTNNGDLSNHKSSLLHHGKMSLEKFIKWCNVLDLKFKIIIEDRNEHVPNPMNDILEEEM